MWFSGADESEQPSDQLAATVQSINGRYTSVDAKLEKPQLKLINFVGSELLHKVGETYDS